MNDYSGWIVSFVLAVIVITLLAGGFDPDDATDGPTPATVWDWRTEDNVRCIAVAHNNSVSLDCDWVSPYVQPQDGETP